ncbi:MAG: L-histidine N(alpha)-methyltransferase, partial [Cyanobacteria bacterium J06559_1]
MQQWQIVPAHQALFHHLVSVIAAAEAVDWKQINAQPHLLEQHPSAKAELTLIQRCGENLADVLQGKIDPLTLLFPSGDASDLTQLYQSSPGAQLMNQQVQQLVSRLTSSASQPLRILEIGAGTGGTTAHLLPCLGQAEYVFTDISPLFLAKAKERFSDYPHLSFHRLDIEKSVEAQGFGLGDYDVVIAANVLHATADVTQALENVRSLLTPSGQLILLEGTQPLLWLDLIFGMTEGWWKRPTHPLLSVAEWQQHLQMAGFSTTIPLVPSENTERALQSVLLDLPQSIIIATQPSEPAPKPDWLILTEPNTGLGEALSQKLGGELVQIQDASALTEVLSAGNLQADRIVYLMGQPSDRNLTELSGAELETLTQQTSTGILKVLKSQLAQGNAFPHLSIVTQGVVNGAGGLTQSPAWGLARVVELEYPTLNCRRIDLDPDDTLAAQLQCLHQELQTTAIEKSVVYRQQNRRVARLSHYSKTNQLTIPSEPFALTLPTKGSPDSLALVAANRQQPQPGEVEVRVTAAGLNFIDVLDALALLPFERDWLGVECSGEVVAKGESVENFTIGDQVLALAAGSFGQYVTVPAEFVVAQPLGLTAQEAATIPANFLTAHYALQVVAQLKKGERILIHSAAGGTGMAAVKVAQLIGAQIYATASPGKWSALEALGVTHIMNSRTVDFAEEIMVKTNGQGVDVVLNSLSGEFIGKSLSALGRGGRFVEIGKRDIWTAQQVADVRPDVDYYVVDLMSVAQERPADIQVMLRSLKQQFDSQKLTPISHRTFPITAAPQAFRYMQQAQHIGKVVLDMQVPSVVDSDDSPSIKAEGTYLITGGTGGLGLATAKWLVTQGAQHMVLLSRGQTETPAADSWIQQSQKQGIDVRVIQADVSNSPHLQTVFADIKKTMPPLTGVFHAAGVLEDSTLQQLSWSQMKKVLAPKVWGAWNLHQLTEAYSETNSLDFFVLYSSAASLLGSPGQGAHVAANSFLDSLAHHRRAQGLPALSINWGPWAEIGSAAGTQAQQQMEQRGVGAIAPHQGIQALAKLLTQPDLTQIGVIPINWSRFRKQGIENDLFFSHFTEQKTKQKESAKASDNPTQTAKSAHWLNQLNQLPPRRRSAFLTEALQTSVSKVLGLPNHKQVEPTVSFFDLGMDSLMAVELKNQIDTQLGQSISSTVIFEYPTLQTLSAHLVALVSGS